MIYRYYGTGAGTAITSVVIDGRMADTIDRVYIDLGLSAPADGDQVYVELSWNSTSQRGVNDATGILATSITIIELTTSGLSSPNLFKAFVFDKPVPWAAGERLFLHMYTSSTTTVTAYATVVTSKDVDGNRPTSKRR